MKVVCSVYIIVQLYIRVIVIVSMFSAIIIIIIIIIRHKQSAICICLRLVGVAVPGPVFALAGLRRVGRQDGYTGRRTGRAASWLLC